MKKLSLALFVAFGLGAWAQQSVLDEYIAMGLEGNLALQHKQMDYTRSIEKLRQAKSYFFPEVKLQARYSRADGGRTFDIPVGDMLNPVYETLNLLTNGSFPLMEIENEEFSLLRTKEHETKMRLVQPVINGDVWYNHKIKEQMVGYHKANFEEYKHALVAEIKTAYYNYLKSLQLLQIIKSTNQLLAENVRVANKLFKNQKVTIDHVYKAEAEMSKNDERKAQAIKQNNTSRAYFNFLLNRNLTDSIETADDIPSVDVPASLQEKQQEAIEQRQLLTAVNCAVEARVLDHQRNKANYWPDLSLVFDYGFQGETYQFDMEHDFYIASLVLEWPIFRGMRRKSQVQQSKVEVEQMKNQLQQLESKIKLEVTSAWYELQEAYATIGTRVKVLEATTKSHKVAQRKYAEGMLSQVEYLDALNDLRMAQEKHSIAQYDYLISIAEFEHVVASININERYGK